MGRNKFKAPKGTRDILPEEAKKREYIEEIAKEIFQLYNYQPIITPLFEKTELFIRGIGESTDIVQKEMYTFQDKKGRSLTLRPEGTASIVRAFLEHNFNQKPFPLKLFYIGPMYRFERPQAGRSREFWQIGAEAIGSIEPAIDAEIICLMIEYLTRLGLKDFTLLLNSMGCPKCRLSFIKVLEKYLHPFKGELCPDCVRRLSTNLLRIYDCKNKNCLKILRQGPIISHFLCEECLSHFKELQALLTQEGIHFQIEPFLARGLDYYTKTTFEVRSPYLGAQNAIGGGGRYDGLIEELGGDSTPGIGFAIGVERLLLHAEVEKIKIPQAAKPKVFIGLVERDLKREAFKILQDLRDASISAEMDFLGRSLKSQIRLADKLGVSFVLFIGPDEMEKGVVKVRDMESGLEEEIKKDNLIFSLKKKLSVKDGGNNES